MHKVIMMTEAVDFMNSIQDPIVKHVVECAYFLVFKARENPEGQFDVRHYLRLVYHLCADTKTLIEMLQGIDVDPLGQDLPIGSSSKRNLE